MTHWGVQTSAVGHLIFEQVNVCSHASSPSGLLKLLSSPAHCGRICRPEQSALSHNSQNRANASPSGLFQLKPLVFGVKRLSEGALEGQFLRAVHAKWRVSALPSALWNGRSNAPLAASCSTSLKSWIALWQSHVWYHGVSNWFCEDWKGETSPVRSSDRREENLDLLISQDSEPRSTLCLLTQHGIWKHLGRLFPI